jgi:glycosyl hydrolase family 106( putative alpha-L-rhamnosidase)
MNRNHLGTLRLALALAAAALIAGPGPAADLEAGFQDPPPEARPWVYWFVMDGNLSREGITADLEAMARAGLGGVIFMEVDLGIPRGPVRFLSAEWKALFKHAVAEAERLGLEITLNAGPGWTGSGGPWVKPEESMQHLVASEVTASGPGRFDAVLPRPEPRRPFFGEGGLPPEIQKARKEFLRDVAVLAFPTPRGAARIADIDEKALYLRAPYSSQPGVKPRLPAPAEHPVLPSDQCIARDGMVDLTAKLSPEGRLTWDVPEGNWTILRFARATTGQITRPAPEAGLGLECDKFDRTALDAHFEAFVGSLLSALGPRKASGRGWTMLHIDSWEMSSQNWTARFREEFQRRRGYDPLRFLPAMTGRVVESLEVSERFLWDLRQTAQELVVENHALHLKELGRRHGLGLSIEPYDMNPCADLTLGGAADVPMCEFWAWGHGFETEYSCFEAVSIAHTRGLPIVAAESFTSGDSEAWRLHPGALKAQGDWALSAGINRIVIHRSQHQPRLDRFPGMTMGPYGVHWERTQTWWDLSPAYHRYLARCQFLLRRGLPVADICYLAPEGSPQVFQPPRSALEGIPPARRGFNFDGCAPEVVLERMAVQDGRIIFPDGMSYRVLVLPDVETMTPALLRKVKELIEAGATVIGAPPRKSPGLSGYPGSDGEVRELGEAIWGEGESPAVLTGRPLGKGRVLRGGEVGRRIGGAADLSSLLAGAKWIWHREGSPAESAPPGARFFRREVVLDDDARKSMASARFVMTADNSFELWINGRPAGRGDNFHRGYVMDVAALLTSGANAIAVRAENGERSPNPAGLIGCLEIRFSEGKSLVVPTDGSWSSATSAKDGWTEKAASGDGFGPALELGPYGMAPWGQAGKQEELREIYPSYDLVAGVLGGMGVVPDFEADVPLNYTHRRDGEVDIYFVASAGDRPIGARAVFRSAGRRPELWDAVTGERRELPEYSVAGGRTSVPLRFEPHQSFFILFRKAETDARPAGKNFTDPAAISEVSGPWTVRFQAGRGAPEEVTFPALEDWSKHADPGVRHFSGIATYRTRFEWHQGPPERDRRSRIFLDLGKVQIMAGVKLNDRDLGVVWTPPLRVDVTGALRPESNVLEVRVANLWPNRFIGDAARPEDKRVTWTTWNPFRPDSPLLESGLLGPVTLKTE